MKIDNNNNRKVLQMKTIHELLAPRAKMLNNNIIGNINLTDNILNAIEEGMQFRLDNWTSTSSAKLIELNKLSDIQYGILYNTESDVYFVIDINDTFSISNNENLYYRLEIKELKIFDKKQVFQLYKWLNDGIKFHQRQASFYADIEGI